MEQVNIDFATQKMTAWVISLGHKKTDINKSSSSINHHNRIGSTERHHPSKGHFVCGKQLVPALFHLFSPTSMTGCQNCMHLQHFDKRHKLRFVNRKLSHYSKFLDPVLTEQTALRYAVSVRSGFQLHTQLTAPQLNSVAHQSCLITSPVIHYLCVFTSFHHSSLWNWLKSSFSCSRTHTLLSRGGYFKISWGLSRCCQSH